MARAELRLAVLWAPKPFSGLTLAVVASFLVSCYQPARPVVSPLGLPSNPPHIVLVVLDTVRKDHISCYGYSRQTTPNLDGLAESSRVYLNAYSTSSWTAPAHASLFTGRYPIAHNASKEHRDLNAELTTLAEVLTGFGYESLAVVANPVLAAGLGFDQGFSQYHEVWRSRKEEPSPSVYGDLALTGEELKAKGLVPSPDERAYYQIQRSLGKRDAGRPLFLFVNLIGAHAPYNSSGPFLERFSPVPRFDLISEYGSGSDFVADYYLGRVSLTSDELDRVVELYDAEILHVDFILGGIIELLKANSLWDDAVFIVTSDHGENFGKNGHILHYFSLYEDTIQVPLLIHYPRRFTPGTEDAAVAQLTDIFPTLLGVLGVSPKSYPTQGVDLLSVEPRDRRAVFAEYDRPVDYISRMNARARTDQEKLRVRKIARRLRSVIDGRWKLIWGSDGSHEMYNLVEDPAEARNLMMDRRFLEAQVRAFETLTGQMDRYGSPQWRRLPVWESSPQDEVVDPETAEALRALGYY